MNWRAGPPAAAALLVLAGAAQAQAQGPAAPPAAASNANAEAEAFLRALFATYAPIEESTAPPETLGPPTSEAEIAAGEARTYAPELVDLLRRDRASTPRGEIGVLDYDPICGCQDNGRITVDRVVFTPGPGGRLWAATTFTDHDVGNPETGELSVTSTRRFLLERTPAGWRVADVRSDAEDDPGLLSMMRDGVAEQERARTSASGRNSR